MNENKNAEWDIRKDNYHLEKYTKKIDYADMPKQGLKTAYYCKETFEYNGAIYRGIIYKTDKNNLIISIINAALLSETGDAEVDKKRDFIKVAPFTGFEDEYYSDFYVVSLYFVPYRTEMRDYFKSTNVKEIDYDESIILDLIMNRRERIIEWLEKMFKKLKMRL